MSQEGTWKMGDSTATVLFTKEDEVVATRDTHREKESAGSSRFACYFFFFSLIIWNFDFHLDFHAMVHYTAKCFENALFT